MRTRLPLRILAVSTTLFCFANPSIAYAAYTSTVVGTTATMNGDGSGDSLRISQSGGLFQHDRFPADPGFNSVFDFDTTVAGDQTVSSTTGIININAGAGNDTIILADGIDLRGAVDGGGDTDLIQYEGSTGVRVNLGLRPTVLNGVLTADQQNPQTTHPGTGTVSITNYDIVTRTFDVNITVSDLASGDVTGFHIHQGPVNADGPVIVDFGGLTRVPSGTGFTATATALIMPALSEAAFLGGGTYVNIHTAEFGAGAIRAQLFSPASESLLSGIATGMTAITNVENVTGSLSGDSLVGNGAANIVNGDSGIDWIVGGPGSDTLNGGADGDVLAWNNGDGSDVVDGGDGSDIVQVNGNPVGDDAFTVAANATRINFSRVSPAFSLDIGTTETFSVNGAGGNDVVSVNVLTGVANLSVVNVNGFDGDDLISYGQASTGIAFNTRAGPGVDLVALGDGVNLLGAVDGGTGIDRLDYAVYSTPVRANLGLGTIGLTGIIGGDQQNPPTSHTGSGTATVTNYNPTTRTFDITVNVTDLPSAEVTGFHIHQAAVGVNGPIIVDFTGLPRTPSGTGFTFTATGLVLPAASEAAFLGGGTYVNIHTAVFGDGAIRGQLFSTGNVTMSSGVATGTTGVMNVENLNGGLSDDSLIGTDGANFITGAGGSDWIIGGPGSDVMIGDAGADVLVWNNGDGTDVIEGGADSDTAYVNGNVSSGDVFTVGPAGTRVDFDRVSPGPFSLDIGTTETLTVNGVGGADSVAVTSLAGVASLTAVNLNGFDANDAFTVVPFATGSVTVAGGVGTDTLTYDAQSRPVGGDTMPPDGSITSTGVQPVNFRHVEFVTVANPEPTITIGDVTVSEGANAVFTVSLSNASALTVTVNFATADGSALAPGDYSSSSGTVTFAPGQTTQTISIATAADVPQEAAEMFVVNLSGAANSTIADALGQATIADTSAAPTLTINDVMASEGGTAIFTVTLSAASAQTITVNFATADGNAMAPGDYMALMGVLTFTPGQTTAMISVPIATDVPQDAAEMFVVNLSGATNSTIADAQGQATIVDTSPAPPAPPAPSPPAPPSNQAPSLSGLGDRTIEESTSTVFTLNVADDATAAGLLSVTATSSNPDLLPASSIVIGGPDAARTLTLTPTPETTGQATITVMVSDGQLTSAAAAILTVTAAPPPQPPTGLTGTSNGAEVTLTWIEPAIGARPTFYTIEAGDAPGATTLPTIITPSALTRFTLPLPQGVYFFRVRSANRAGASERSNETTVAITTAAAPPGPPHGLAATVNGSRVTLRWQLPVGGGALERWQLEVGSSAGASNLAIFGLPPTVTAVSADVPPGEYFARVRGVNGTLAGLPSNETSFRVGDLPACDAPLAPVLLPATVVGRTVTLSWRAPRGTAIGNYRLVIGFAPGGSDLAVFDVGAVTSFAASAPPGRYFVTLVGINACGTSDRSNSVEVFVP